MSNTGDKPSSKWTYEKNMMMNSNWATEERKSADAEIYNTQSGAEISNTQSSQKSITGHVKHEEKTDDDQNQTENKLCSEIKSAKLWNLEVNN